MTDPASRAGRLNRAIGDLLAQAPEVEAAAVVSFDGLPMASALPATMDEDRVAAMSAALLSLGERAAEGLGRGALSQVYIEGEHGTVFLVSADDEAVLVAVASPGAKVGMMLYEVRRAADVVAEVLRAETPVETPVQPVVAAQPVAAPVTPPVTEPVAPVAEPVYAAAYAAPVAAPVESLEPVTYAPAEAATAVTPQPETTWPSYLTTDTPAGTTEPTPWS
jgi:predicted regulator of Ras-like GTPase activity (Roadblock/LC7/MglB family)